MKTFLLEFAILVVALTSVCAFKDKRYLEEWNKFKQVYNKTYKLSEEPKRMAIWKKNFEYVIQHNEEAKSGRHTFTVKMNKFGDLSSKEFAKLFRSKLNVTISNSQKVSSSDKHYKEIPDSIDWRTKGCTSPVRVQSIYCNDILYFGVTESLAGISCAKTGDFVPLSAQQLVDCSSKFGNSGCTQSTFENTYKYIQANNGIDSESSYPFIGELGRCQFKKDGVVLTINGYERIISGNETDLTAALGTLGPIAVGIDASRPSFQFYTSGVYYEPSCSSNIDHVLTLEGYGTTDAKEDYYIAKNSWGTSWGENGYILMSRNRNNNCGIATYALYGLVN